MSEPLRVLVVEDSADDSLLIEMELRRHGFDLTSERVDTARAMNSALVRQTWDVIVSDYTIPGFGGIEALEVLHESGLDLPFIIVSGAIGERVAVEAMKAGAHDYVLKDNLARLGPVVQRELQEAAGRQTRRQTEELLRASEERYRRLVETSPDAITVTDLSGKIIMANQRVAELHGYANSDELLGRGIYELFAPDDRHRVAENSRKALAEGGVRNVEYTMLRRDGTTFSAELSGSVLTSADGEPTAFIGVVRDVSERAEAEEALKQRTAQLEALRQVGLGLTAQLDLHALLQSIVSRAIELLDGTSGGLYLHRPEQDVLEWSMGIGPGLPPVGSVLHPGEGLCGRVWETGAPLIVNDYWRWEGRSDRFDGLPNVASVGVLVRWGDELLGVLNVVADIPGVFSPADADLLELFATQASIAIRNARLYEEARNRARRLEVVNYVAWAASATLELDDLLEIVYREVMTIFKAEAFFIALYDPQANELDFRFQVDEGDLQEPVREPVGTGLTSLVVTGGEPLLIHDMEKEQASLPKPQLWGTMKLPASWLGVPMQIWGRLVGVICVQSYAPNAFSQEDQQLLSTIADQVAAVVENAQLYQTLHESEERFRRLSEVAEEGIAIHEQGVIVDANEALARMFGYEISEIVGQQTDELTSQESWDVVRAHTDSGPGRPQEILGMRKDSSTFHCELASRPFQYQGRTLQVATFRDISERKRAEKALRENEERYRNLFHHSNDGILVHDLEGNIMDLNQRALTQMGYSRSELQSLRIHDLHPPEALDASRLAFEKVTRDGLVEFEISFRRKDGQIFPAEVSSSLFEIGGKKVVQEVVRDITERRRVERLLGTLNEAALAVEQALTLEETFTAVGEQFKKLGFSCAILRVDKSQSKLYPIYYSYESKAVKTAEKLLGIKAENLALPIDSVKVFREAVREGKTLFAAGDGTVRQVLPKPLKRFARQIIKILGVPQSVIVPLIVEDQVIGLLTVQSDDLTEEDAPAIGAFAHQMAAGWRKAQLLQDLENSLDELKRTQAQLFQSQKMEALGRLAGGIAHDFNNLLTVIELSTRLLERQLRPEDPLWEHVQRIQETSDRAAKLTRQLLSFSRRELIEPRVVNLSDLVGDLSNMLKRIIGEDVELATSLPEDLCMVEVDPGQMEQVVVNLVVNARDAMPQGGILTIETANAVLEAPIKDQYPDAQPGEYAVLSVKDTGVGMDERVRAHLFEPFFTTKERGQGTGLGLPTVFGIVKQSGGHIRVESALGQGTTLRIYLPRAEKRDPAVETSRLVLPPPTTTTRGTETILVVEDDAVVRGLAVNILKAHGYQVLAAGHGQDALRVSRGHGGPIHLLLVDVVMPDINGKELAERLRSERPELRVLYTSGYSDDVIAHHGILEEGIAFLAKPFTLEAVTQKVRDTLDAE
jgi:PAS domain S-box-containing protein